MAQAVTLYRIKTISSSYKETVSGHCILNISAPDTCRLKRFVESHRKHKATTKFSLQPEQPRENRLRPPGTG